MKRILTFLTILVFVTSLLAIASAQPRRRKSNVNVNRRATQTEGQQRAAIGAGGAGTYARNRRGRYVTRNGKRIWVPQGSPIKNPGSPAAPTRGVYEREEEAELKNNKPTTKPTP